MLDLNLYISSILISWLNNTEHGKLGEVVTIWQNKTDTFIGKGFFQIMKKGEWITYWQNKDYKLINTNI